jgi:ligand-binding sensor domain-containing protein
MKSLCLVLLLWLALPVHAQLRFENFSVEKGMSASTVLDIVQTEDGFIWIATADGLNRFDGQQFLIFRTRPGEKMGLRDNYITSLAEDKEHQRLWIGCNDGSISVLDLKKLEFREYEGIKAINKAALPILALQADSRGNLICLLQQGGAWLISDAGVQQIPLPILANDTSFLPVCVAIDPGGLIWLGGLGGIRVVDTRNPGTAITAYLQSEIVNALAWAGDHCIAATNQQGLWKVSRGLAKPLQGDFSKGLLANIVALHVDNHGNLWGANNYFDGLVRLKYSDNRITERFHCLHNPFDHTTLINNSVLSLAEDREGNMWVGTLSGMSVFKPLNQQYAIYRHVPGNTNTLSGSNTYALFEDTDGSVWTGTLDAGMNRIYPDGRIVHFGLENTTGLTTNSVRSICRDAKGRYWVGAGNEGLFQFDPIQRRFSRVNIADDEGYSLDMLQVKSMAEDVDGGIWLGTTASLWKYFPDRKKLIRFPVVQESLRRFPNLPDYQIIDIKIDRIKSEVICATFGQGLFIMNTNGSSIRNYVADTALPGRLTTNNLMSVTILNPDTLLLGTYGGGLSVFNRNTERFTAITGREGLPNDVVYGVIPAKDGSWWMSTNRGLVRYEPGSRKFRHLDQLSQIQSFEFNEGAVLQSRDGSFWFGGINGINRFFPDKIEVNQVQPEVWITRVRVLEKPIRFDSVYHAGLPLLLGYRQNFLRLDFSALSYTNPEKNRYKYILEGFDEDWIEAGNSGTAAYTNVPPGRYVFRVKACNDDGIWSEKGTALIIEIKPPFWRTWWFLIACLFTGTIALFVFFRARTASLRRSYQLSLAESELRALRGQMNPHFIFNSINSIQYYVLNKSPKEAYSYLAKFSSLMRLILQNSRQSVIPFEQEMNALHTYLELEKLRLDGQLDYAVEVDPTIVPAKDMIPSMLIQPYVENAILHGLNPKKDGRHLRVAFRKIGDHLFVVVEDNGIGRKAANELNKRKASHHQSTGMSVTKQRLEMLNRRYRGRLSVSIIDLSDLQGVPTGTRVELFIPVIQEGSDENSHH